MKDLKRLEFKFHFYDLYTDVVNELRNALSRVATALDPKKLNGPLFAMTHELAANALKALYKRAFYKYLIQELGLEDVTYDDWLNLFRTEIEEHNAENFARICREKKINIEVSGKIDGDIFRIQVVNDGTPTEIEMKRIQKTIQKARSSSTLAYLFMDDGEDGDDGDDAKKEGGSMGIPIIIMSLRGLGISPDNFVIKTSGDKTIASIDLPLSAFGIVGNRTVTIMKRNKKLLATVWNIFCEVNYGAVKFSEDGELLAVSLNLLEALKIPPDKVNKLETLIPDRFFEDNFSGPQGIRVTGKFLNYRIYIRPLDNSKEKLYNISGYGSSGKLVNTLWQEVYQVGGKSRLSEGRMMEDVRARHIIEPYLPTLALSKAREMVNLGKNKLPDEVKELSIFFADLVGFTQKAETMEPHMLMELLNSAMSICVRSIEKNDGQIDKFMGDAVLAIFENPLSAVVAAMEIQKLYYDLNELRRLSSEDDLLIRIGVNTGTVIMGSIGTENRMDWTVIGDVVNTASRIEKKAQSGSVLISESTYNKIKDRVNYKKKFIVKVKGKQKELTVYEINKVSFEHEKKSVDISLEG